MNLKMMFAAGMLAALPLAAQAEMTPMADPELRTVQGQGPILNYGLGVIEDLVDLGELDTFDNVLVNILDALDVLIDAEEPDTAINLLDLPVVFGDSVVETRTNIADLYAFRAELNEGVADRLPGFTALGDVAASKLRARADRFTFLGGLIAP